MSPSMRNWRRTSALYSGLLAASIIFGWEILPAVAADPAPPIPKAERQLNDPEKTLLQKKLQQRAAKEKISALKELATYPYDLEAVKQIVNIGLREPIETVYAASTNAILESRQSPVVGQFLIDRLEQEVGNKKRPHPEYLQRLTALICRFHFPEVYETLLRICRRSGRGQSPKSWWA